ncbi:MAG TPA: hypothetical protein VM432_05355 [Bdellovibrionales bacterium]|nr:hypothetical protein [Bdellovibrionales bacterium]
MTARTDSFDEQYLLLLQGGLLGRLMSRIGLSGLSTKKGFERALFWVAVVWIPPALLTLLGGWVSPERLAFGVFSDWSFQIRCLVALPIFIVVEGRIQAEFSAVIPAFASRNFFSLVDEQKLQKIGSDLRRFQTYAIVDVVTFGLSLAIVSQRLYIDLPGQFLNWKTAESLPYVMASHWNQWVSLPIYYYFALRWIVRFFAWSYFLLRTALLRPRLTELHPDRTGGLSFILRYQKMFGIVLFGISAVASANIAMVVKYGNQPIDAFRDPILLYLFIVNAAISLPLLVFTPELVKTRHRGLIQYSRLANIYANRFEQKWMTSPENQDPLGTSDIQSLNDLHGSYRSQAQMRISLMDVRTLTAITVLAALPLLPLLLFKFPVMHLITMIMKYFFKI